MASAPGLIPLELENGARMTQAEFHRLYEQTPPDFRAELIRGIVYVASPLQVPHGSDHLHLGILFGTYKLNTRGTQAGDNTTVLLGDEGEPQPDLYLRILPEYGGQSGTTRKKYVAGAPELVAEIASSSKAIDLHDKRLDYARYGVREYLVLCVKERELRWFDLRADEELTPDADGVIRVHCFPGLWIDVRALLNEEARMLEVLAQGLATQEHAAFVEALETAARRRGGSKVMPRHPGTRKKRRGERGTSS